MGDVSAVGSGHGRTRGAARRWALQGALRGAAQLCAVLRCVIYTVTTQNHQRLEACTRAEDWEVITMCASVAREVQKLPHTRR